MKTRYILFTTIAFLMNGCITVKGEIAEEDRSKIMDCTDTRDGERFSFSAKTVTNVRVSILTEDGSLDLIDMNGTKRSITKSMEKYLKCKERKNKK